LYFYFFTDSQAIHVHVFSENYNLKLKRKVFYAVKTILNSLSLKDSMADLANASVVHPRDPDSNLCTDIKDLLFCLRHI
jgi:hypothetical protein